MGGRRLAGGDGGRLEGEGKGREDARSTAHLRDVVLGAREVAEARVEAARHRQVLRRVEAQVPLACRVDVLSHPDWVVASHRRVTVATPRCHLPIRCVE